MVLTQIEHRRSIGVSATEYAVDYRTSVYLKSILVAPRTSAKYTKLKVLKPASNNVKLSARSNTRVQKGPKEYQGKPLYNLTLVERETCPRSCEQWANCYGNNMPFAKRYLPGSQLTDALAHDLKVLNIKHPEGFVIRLHILGDFYSEDYVAWWNTWLVLYPKMVIYGYTHREHDTRIGDRIAHMVDDHPGRVSILRSDRKNDDDPLPGAYTVKKGTEPSKDILVCPQQTGATESCLTCGLCFHGHIPVQFLEH